MQEIFCYNPFVPVNFEKKEAPLAAKVEPSLKRRIEQIAADEDRTVSYVVGALLGRGLSAFQRDGMLRDEVRQLAPVVAHPAAKEVIRKTYIGDDIDELGTVDYTDEVSRQAERIRLSLLKADAPLDDPEAFDRAFRDAEQQASKIIAKKRKAKG